MSITQTQLMTAEEFYVWANRPENQEGCHELERGRIVEVSRPGKLHGLICANVARILGNHVAGRKKGYVCSNDTGVVVGRNPDTVRGPDVLLFEDVDDIALVEEKYGETPPILAVEVLSPNDTYSKVRDRVKEQIRFGTSLVWVLDPDARNITVHFPDGSDKNVRETEVIGGADAPPGFQCPVAEFFSLPGR